MRLRSRTFAATLRALDRAGRFRFLATLTSVRSLSHAVDILLKTSSLGVSETSKPDSQLSCSSSSENSDSVLMLDRLMVTDRVLRLAPCHKPPRTWPRFTLTHPRRKVLLKGLRRCITWANQRREKVCSVYKWPWGKTQVSLNRHWHAPWAQRKRNRNNKHRRRFYG